MKHAFLVGTGAVLGLAAALLVGSAPADAQAGPGAGAGAGESPAVVATGGVSPNQNDICWLLFKDKSKTGEERIVLCLYQAMDGGKSFDLTGVREVTYDMKLTHAAMSKRISKFPPAELKKAVDKLNKPGNQKPGRRK